MFFLLFPTEFWLFLWILKLHLTILTFFLSKPNKNINKKIKKRGRILKNEFRFLNFCGNSDFSSQNYEKKSQSYEVKRRNYFFIFVSTHFIQWQNRITYEI